MSEGDNNGSRNGGGSALDIVVALYPEVTCKLLEAKLTCICHYCTVRITCSCYSSFCELVLASERWTQPEVSSFEDS